MHKDPPSLHQMLSQWIKLLTPVNSLITKAFQCSQTRIKWTDWWPLQPTTHWIKAGIREANSQLLHHSSIKWSAAYLLRLGLNEKLESEFQIPRDTDCNNASLDILLQTLLLTYLISTMILNLCRAQLKNCLLFLVITGHCHKSCHIIRDRKKQTRAELLILYFFLCLYTCFSIIIFFHYCLAVENFFEKQFKVVLYKSTHRESPNMDGINTETFANFPRILFFTIPSVLTFTTNTDILEWWELWWTSIITFKSSV